MNKQVVLPTYLTENLAYLCGVFAGDGSLNFREKKKEYSLKVVGNPKDEKEYYDEVLGPAFRQVFGFLPKIKHHDAGTTYGFTVYSKELYYFLVNVVGLPSGVKYGSLKVPETFLADEDLAISFIRGVFDTDGCVSFRKKRNYPVISLTSKSSSFIKQIANYLDIIGFKMCVLYDYKYKDERIILGYTIKSFIYLNGRKNLAYWMSKIGFYSPKHREKVKKSSGDWI